MSGKVMEVNFTLFVSTPHSLVSLQSENVQSPSTASIQASSPMTTQPPNGPGIGAPQMPMAVTSFFDGSQLSMLQQFPHASIPGLHQPDTNQLSIPMEFGQLGDLVDSWANPTT